MCLIQFIPNEKDVVVQYTSHMYANTEHTHIYLLPSDDTEDWEENYLLKISFKRNLGVDFNIADKPTLVIDIEDWTNMEISIKKDYYNSSKKVYLNGNDITSKADYTLSKPPKEGSTVLGIFWYDGIYYFEDFGLIKGNKNNYINTIEYK